MECLSELSEDDTGLFLVCCDNVHAYVALLAFIVYDFCIVSGAITVYFTVTWTDIVPLLALTASIVCYWVGPVFVFTEQQRCLWWYGQRILMVAMFSFAWAAMCFFFSDVSVLMAIIWFVAAVFYMIGYYFSRRTLNYFQERYIGYDGGDPDVELEERNKLEEEERAKI